MPDYFFLGLRLKVVVLLIGILFIFNWHLLIAVSEIKMRVSNITEFTTLIHPSLLVNILTVVFTSIILWLHLLCISCYFCMRVTSGFTLLYHKKCCWCRDAVSTVFYRSLTHWSTLKNARLRISTLLMVSASTLLKEEGRCRPLSARDSQLFFPSGFLRWGCRMQVKRRKEVNNKCFKSWSHTTDRKSADINFTTGPSSQPIPGSFYLS